MTETFFKYLQFEKRLSRNTLSAYRIDILQFESFLKVSYEVDNIAEATYPMIRSWIIQLTETEILPRSINRKIAALKSMFKFLLMQGFIAHDPSTKVTVLKSAKRIPSFVRENELNVMLDNAVHADDFEGTRDKLIIELFYGTGMRLSELLGLTEQSFNMGERTVRVLGKRNKQRIVPFAASLVPLISDYLSRRSDIVAPQDTAPFFISASGSPCYPMLVYRTVKKHLAATTVQRKSPHILRHTYATHLLDRGAEINAVKDLLGHSSLAATQVYTHNSIEKIKKAFNQAHPKA